MSLSFLLWLSISMFLIVFWGWSSYVLIRQKRAWKFYAQKKKLRYHSNKLMESPSLSGAIDGYKVSIFASEHSEFDARSQRRLTAIEINLHTGIPTACAMGSGGMVPVIEALDLHQEYKPQEKGWDDSYIVRTSDAAITQGYLSDARVQALIKLMSIEKVWVILLFADEYGLLRLDTPLPIDHPKALDDLITQMIDVVRVLELSDGEDKELVRQKKTSNKKQKVLEIDEELLSDDLGIELEDEG